MGWSVLEGWFRFRPVAIMPAPSRAAPPMRRSCWKRLLENIRTAERVPIIDDLILLRDDPEHLAGVLAQVGLRSLGRDQLGRVLAAEVVNPFGA